MTVIKICRLQAVSKLRLVAYVLAQVWPSTKTPLISNFRDGNLFDYSLLDNLMIPYMIPSVFLVYFNGESIYFAVTGLLPAIQVPKLVNLLNIGLKGKVNVGGHHITLIRFCEMYLYFYTSFGIIKIQRDISWAN